MHQNEYLRWMATDTPSMWCNDSAVPQQLRAALELGAVGCTTNPPLSYETLTRNTEAYAPTVHDVLAQTQGDDRVVRLIRTVIRPLAECLQPLYKESGGTLGYVRAQVQPDLAFDENGMLQMGCRYAKFADNVKVKIPGTKAGVAVLEELAARGIATNPTICTTVSQMIACAKAHERGIEKAKRANIQPAPSTSAMVLGRLQDFLAECNRVRALGLSFDDLAWAALAVAKRCVRIFENRGYRQIIMPAAFRCAWQVAGLTGANVMMTIHPKIQHEILQAHESGQLPCVCGIDEPVDEKAVERVRKKLPEFSLAYEEGALSPEQFDSFGANVMTLEAFDRTGWQKLKHMDIHP